MAKRKVHGVFPVIIIILFLSITFNIIFVIREWQRDVVVRVAYGETFTVADGRRVRLLGVDAPELGRCMSSEAKQRLSQLVLGKHIRMKDVAHDDYGRILAHVLADAPFGKWVEYLYYRFIKRAPYKNLVMVNRVMVEEGLGLYHNSGGQYTKVLKSAMEIARTGKRGIYSDLCTQKESPKTHCEIKGNIRDGKKTYFFPFCGNYDEVIVSTSFGDAWFCSEKEANAAGFTKSPTCRLSI